MCTGSVCGCSDGYTVGRPVRASSPRPDPLGHCSPGGGGQEGGRAEVRTVRAKSSRIASERQCCGKPFRPRASQALPRTTGRRAGGAGSSRPFPNSPLEGGDHVGRRRLYPGAGRLPEATWEPQGPLVDRLAGFAPNVGLCTTNTAEPPYTKGRTGHPSGESARTLTPHPFTGYQP